MIMHIKKMKNQEHFMRNTLILLNLDLKITNSAQIWIFHNFWDFLTIFTDFLESVGIFVEFFEIVDRGAIST